MLTRAHFLRLAAAASIGGAFDIAWRRNISAYAQDSGPEPPGAISRRASRLIEAYDRQGIHRTATEVDHQSAAWLANEAKEAGADAGLEAFAIKRVDIRAAYIEADGRRAAALPLFDGTFTDEAGISGTLGPSGSSAPIALLSADAGQISSEGRGFSAARRRRLAGCESAAKGRMEHQVCRDGQHPPAQDAGFAARTVGGAPPETGLRHAEAVAASKLCSRA